jgi:RND family efflux transporter MFP subunit
MTEHHDLFDDTPLAAPPPGLRRGGVLAAATAGLVIVAGVGWRAWHGAEAQHWSDQQATPTVRVVTPKPGLASQDLMLPGTLAAWNNARIFARVPGYIRAWYPDIGTMVRAGEALGTIDTPELDQQIIQARAALARARAEAGLARSTAARWNDLLKSASVSQQDADEKAAGAITRQAAVREAEAALGRLQAMKALAVVRAPFAGIVTARNTDIGDLVGPGASGAQPMFSIADETRIRIYVNVPQQYAALMRQGLTAQLTVPDWPGRAFPARLVGASGAINSQSGTLQVQLATANADRALRSGGYAQIHFTLPGSGNTLTIPASALILRGAGTRVATVDAGGRARLVPVTIGHDLGNAIEIVAGLSRTSKVIDNPPDSLADGALVRLANGHG